VEGYTLDHDRFYISGGSLGGSDAYRLALRYPDKWAAVAPQTGWTDYREFWPHWYEHWDKATVNRRSMFEGFRARTWTSATTYIT
jgi:poly(3-hydroxybutyrate) depolymerase